MIYDRGPVKIYELRGSGTLADGTLHKLSDHYYAELTVFYRRYWASVQASNQIDRLLQIPFGHDLCADLYAVPEDCHVYRIIQAQPGKDEDGIDCCTLSLHREEGNYDIAATGD